MMTHYQFNATIKVTGVTYHAGDVVPKAEVDPGCAQSMLRLGQIEECNAPPPQPSPLEPEQKPEVKPAPRPAKSRSYEE